MAGRLALRAGALAAITWLAACAVAAPATSTAGWRTDTVFAKNISLSSIAARSATDAWAAGSQFVRRRSQPLLLRWQGRGWRRVALPARVRAALAEGILGASIDDVQVPAADSAWIDNQQGWASWNGRGWRAGRFPVAHRGESSQSGQLLAFGSADAWLAGTYFAKGGPRIFAESFDGSSWRAMPAPGIPGGGTPGLAVSGSSSSAICAVTANFGSVVTQPHVLACWNGSGWHRVGLPAILRRQDASLASILVGSAGDIWIGGGLPQGSGVAGLLAHWRGHNWRVGTAPMVPHFSYDVLDALTSDGRAGLWAEGACVGHLQGKCGGIVVRLWHYTGGRWMGPANPPVRTIAAVPGTRSAWAIGTSGSPRYRPAILVHGAVGSLTG